MCVCVCCNILGIILKKRIQNKSKAQNGHLPTCSGLSKLIVPSSLHNMSVSVDVKLLSGKTATVTAGLDEGVEALKLRAQTALGVGRGRLVNPAGSIVDASATIKESNVHNGDSLTLQIFRSRLGAVAMVVTDVLCSISCRMSGRSKSLDRVLLLPFCATDPS